MIDESLSQLSEAERKEWEEYNTPNYETRYRKFLATIKEYATVPRTDIWAVATCAPGAAQKLDASKRADEAYCAESATLATQLVYVDLGSLGIAPPLARLIILARLLSDDAPINDLRNEVNVAAAEVIESLTAPETSADTLPNKPLFTKNMWVIGVDEGYSVAPEALEPVAPLPVQDPDKWLSAMTTQGAA